MKKLIGGLLVASMMVLGGAAMAGDVPSNPTATATVTNPTYNYAYFINNKVDEATSLPIAPAPDDALSSGIVPTKWGVADYSSVTNKTTDGQFNLTIDGDLSINAGTAVDTKFIAFGANSLGSIYVKLTQPTNASGTWKINMDDANFVSFGNGTVQQYVWHEEDLNKDYIIPVTLEVSGIGVEAKQGTWTGGKVEISLTGSFPS